jgi:pimeloyl-ACP methyl ester carboxylesterase
VLVDGADRLGVVSVPTTAREPRPIMIALHGGSEKPEVACDAWRLIVDAYAFVVCPRGFGGNDARLGWRTPGDTQERIMRAVNATKKMFGASIKDTPTFILAGFSMGATQVAHVARTTPQLYRRIVIGDAAYDPQPTFTFAQKWIAGGGERALFLCTTSGCEPSMRNAAKRVSTEHAPARLNIAATQKHGLSVEAGKSLRRDWPWITEGTPGWETFASSSTDQAPGKTESFEAAARKP